ncbi:hypothetical protein yc1106_01958 [Curvularia clavata]|uniref:Uncharacterized protein n=1 Tax=Curvularia clavata TaxID=95742 RepID=A0A9Q8Z2C1_CURCL|nr:hypothetical protein yc1106_01958 [Curvularia clavata]
MQYFTSQLRAQHDTPRARQTALGKKTRKTKGKRNYHASTTEADDEDDGDEPGQEETEEVQEQAHPPSRIQSSAALAPPEKAQLRVAGLGPGQANEIPPPPFPHAPASTFKKPYGSTKIHDELAKPPFRLYAVDPAPRQHEGSKRDHLDNLSTLMHLSLLRGDYERAGRAWGMILRTHVAGGRPVDPRNHGRWGIGAEIALRRKPQTAGSTSPNEPQVGHIGRFSDEGFELARDYYNRLIVQHPNRKTQPHIVDERMFYPPMFSLWVYEVCEKSKRAKLQLQDELANRSVSSRSMSVDSAASDRPDDLRDKEDAIRTEELTQAMEIAERLDQVIASPPFDKQANLLQLRGNIALWISDLAVGKTGVDEDTGASAQSSSHSRIPNPDRLQRLTSAYRELKRAEQFFERAAANGAEGQAPLLSSIDMRLREVTNSLEKLRSSQTDDYSSFDP